MKLMPTFLRDSKSSVEAVAYTLKKEKTQTDKLSLESGLLKPNF